MPIYPTTEEEQRVFKCISRWLTIADRAGREMPADPGQFCINMQKSALLRRLLDGTEPFPLPPPKAYSYPWYSLLEKGEVSGYLDHSKYGDDRLNISQSLWYIIEQLGYNHYLVQYNKEEGSIWELSPMTEDEVYSLMRARTASRIADEEVRERSRQTLAKYGHLKLHTPGKNNISG